MNRFSHTRKVSLHYSPSLFGHPNAHIRVQDVFYLDSPIVVGKFLEASRLFFAEIWFVSSRSKRRRSLAHRQRRWHRPAHIPQALSLIASAQSIFPEATQFACFDDVFHQTMPEVASHLPLPQRYFEAGVRRYGFHGLSYESLVHHFGDQLPERAIFAHLGNGASLCALRNRVSVDTTMGLTPTGGIPMSTRTGDLDPGVLLYLLRTEKLSADAIEDLINHKSGLYALSSGQSDVKALEERARSNDSRAILALNAFATAVRKVIGAYVALLGGIDLLVFTGGIGEHSEYVRSAVTNGLEMIGLTPEKIKVVPAEEEQQIARHCRRLLAQAQH